MILSTNPDSSSEAFFIPSDTHLYLVDSVTSAAAINIATAE